MNRNRSRKFFQFSALLGVFLYLTCPLTAWGQQRERVRLKQSWLFTAATAPTFLGMEKGFFKAEGIDLNFESGSGSGKNLQLLSTKKLLIGFADLGTAAKFIGQGVDVKAVYGWTQVSPMCIIAHEDKGIKHPKDLEGKKVGRLPASSGWQIFPAVAKHNRLDVSKINFVNVTFAARNTSFLHRDVDAIIAYCPGNVPILRSKGAKVNFLRYANIGANTLGKGIVAHTSILKEKPSVVRGVLRAYSKSVRATLDNPAAAVAALRRASPLTVQNPKVSEDMLKASLVLVHTRNSQGKPLGWMAKKDWEDTIEILTKYGGLKNPRSPEAYYTNQFISVDIM